MPSAVPIIIVEPTPTPTTPTPTTPTPTTPTPTTPTPTTPTPTPTPTRTPTPSDDTLGGIDDTLGGGKGTVPSIIGGVLRGTETNDSLVGSPGPDVISGLQGNDNLQG
ncbi:MAG: calcium-binding protein, partial [Microcoleus sp. PH2017_04_SCI_O_A]|nr:calcium-binding protein [Microcoleus sp. PH2017_04_SCI_O_A]